MNMITTITNTALATGVALALAIAAPANADDTTTFSYQGELNESGTPVEGAADFEFSLWDDPIAGLQRGTTIIQNNVPLTAGRFNVQLDFGAEAFETESCWLQIVVDGTPLSPRQPLTRAPYSIRTRGIQVDEDMNVGLGVIPGSARLRVWNLDAGGGISSTAAGRAIEAVTLTGDMAVLGSNQADDGIGVFGQNQPTGNWGYLGSDQYGVYARALDQENHWGAYFVGRGYISGNTFIGRESGITAREKFGVHSQADDAVYGGMYVSTSSDGGWPFYGYAAGQSGGDCWHYYDGLTGKWKLNNNGTRLTIDGSGHVGVGLTDPVARLHVVSPAAIAAVLGESESVGVEGRCSSAFGFDFYASGAGVNYGSQSSRRWKHNINTIADPLELIAQLRGVTYEWNEEHGGQADIGFIAEEVGAVLPEIVAYEANGIDAIGMDYAKLTPLLVEAIKAEQAQREAEIDELRRDNEELRARLDTLEALVREMASSN